jgi:hypothetical protein
MINDFGRCKIHPTAAQSERLWVFLWPGMALPPSILSPLSQRFIDDRARIR